MGGDGSSETPRFEPRDPGYEARVRASFEKQQFMATLGASLAIVQPGIVRIDLPYDVRLTQQHGFLHAGAIASVLDSAAGYAALSLAARGRACFLWISRCICFRRRGGIVSMPSRARSAPGETSRFAERNAEPMIRTLANSPPC